MHTLTYTHISRLTCVCVSRTRIASRTRQRAATATSHSSLVAPVTTSTLNNHQAHTHTRARAHSTCAKSNSASTSRSTLRDTLTRAHALCKHVTATQQHTAHRRTLLQHQCARGRYDFARDDWRRRVSTRDHTKRSCCKTDTHDARSYLGSACARTALISCTAMLSCVRERSLPHVTSEAYLT
jgi:hypothetical protein